MVKTDAVVTVFERQHALDLVRLDHRRQNIVHLQRRFAFCAAFSAQVVSYGQYAAQIV